MKASLKIIFSFLFLLLSALLFSSFEKGNAETLKFAFPYKQAGLTERQAAAHLLSRFTYGAKSGDVDQVVKMGLERWFQQQLEGGVKDEQLDRMLVQYKDINLTNSEVEDQYPRRAKVLRMAIKDGFINKDSLNKGDQKAYRTQLQAYMTANGLKPEAELLRQFINQKILRAAYTNNQLHELLTDFWFNHFNVSLTKNQCASFVPAFERDVIRPNVTGKFQTLLMATAKSPAMLVFLDNFTSTGERAATLNIKDMQMVKKLKPAALNRLKQLENKKKAGGLNENYAREVMELHTLGVDAGYTQNDVTEAARVLTGWTVVKGDFLFAPNRHDNGVKTVLGKTFAAGGGYQEGVELLSMLAHHPSTAKFISRKLATRFVNDSPSQKLVDKMVKVFSDSDGDIKQVMLAMTSSAEFWNSDALREKTKSPFELAMSAVRSLNAEITQPYQLFSWINKMGQKMYYYQAPTGFPDRGQYWINTGSLLNRMNFGLALAAQRIPGIKFNLSLLNNHHEPESAEAALATYAKLIMPERNLEETVKRLKPMLKEPELLTKVEKAAAKAPVAQGEMQMEESVSPVRGNNAMLAQVVGVIIGSPEFQRK